MLKFNPLEHPVCLSPPARLTLWSAWQGHIPFAMFLVDILRPEVLVELGTHYGDSYCAFCQAVKELKLNTKCYGVDTWQGDPHTSSYGLEVLADLRNHHDALYGSFSRLVQSTFDQALSHFGDGTVDLLHIDGYHTYAAVRHDFESWLPKMSPRGVVLLHDINVRELDFGARRFLDEIKPRYRCFEFLHSHGLGVLALNKVESEELQELIESTDNDATVIRDFFFHIGDRLVMQTQMKIKDAQMAQLQRSFGLRLTRTYGKLFGKLPFVHRA